jgi:hypothetical protein
MTERNPDDPTPEPEPEETEEQRQERERREGGEPESGDEGAADDN